MSGCRRNLIVNMNTSEKVFMNMSVSIYLNEGSSMIRCINISVCTNLQNKCVSMSVRVSLSKIVS